MTTLIGLNTLETDKGKWTGGNRSHWISAGNMLDEADAAIHQDERRGQ